MYITKIKIRNYRNFANFTMEFQKGLNVIIGANNSGKTGLLYAIQMLSKPEITSAHDFNKNVISQFATRYQEDAPKIEFEFEIRHEISEDDTEDESIVKLLPFLGMKDIESAHEENGKEKKNIYSILAIVKMTFSLDVKALGNYKQDVKSVHSLDEFVSLLDMYIERYKWTFTNSKSNTEADKKDALGIFDIRFIGAERTSSDVAKETKREIEDFTKDQNNAAEIRRIKDSLSNDIKKLLKPALTKMASVFENEKNEIGLSKGNVSIFQNIRADISVADAYITDVKDTTGNFVVPLHNNGLGYNNLINIYILIKLTEIRKGKDFRILCLEEPEAHLHPSLQYKLFKFLKELDETDQLNQQIFVTTHSSNISAVAGIDNMYMLGYNRKCLDCRQQSLKILFKNKEKAKNHLTKFLDVTRSDMLFAENVILVEGIAEKLLLPLFMEKCGCSYEDESISIVEIGGKFFEHFIELFNGNTVQKKVLCITDRDFKWITESGKDKILSCYELYKKIEPSHITKLKTQFDGMSNLFIATQTNGGRTFEDEFFLSNFDMGKNLMEIVATETISKLLEEYGIDYDAWDKNRPKAKDSKVSAYLDIFNVALDEKEAEKNKFYKKLFFAELFLYYSKEHKGDVALSILTHEVLSSTIVVPQYIKEGLEWLLK